MSGQVASGGGPTDWGSGERVFGPPGGTLDPDWLVPALLERHPGDPDGARSALVGAWRALREEAAASGLTPAAVDPGAVLRRLGLLGPDGSVPPARQGDALRRAAVDVVRAAARAYDAR